MVRTVASIAVFALTLVAAVPPAAHAAGALYQWLDEHGNVMYGDSPPRVSGVRRVGSDDPAPIAVTPPEPATNGPVTQASAPADTAKPQALERDAALEAALAKLDAVMQQVNALTGKLQSNSQTAPPTEQAALAHVEVAPTPVLGAQPLLEVAMPEAQPIESRLSARERDRSRWDAESLNQRRFLERLGNLSSSDANGE